jgi:hypothetical protein
VGSNTNNQNWGEDSVPCWSESWRFYLLAPHRRLSATEIMVGRIFTSYVVLACCTPSSQGWNGRVARAHACGSMHRG